MTELLRDCADRRHEHRAAPDFVRLDRARRQQLVDGGAVLVNERVERGPQITRFPSIEPRELTVRIPACEVVHRREQVDRDTQRVAGVHQPVEQLDVVREAHGEALVERAVPLAFLLGEATALPGQSLGREVGQASALVTT